jgi:hypothetical protein
VSSALSNPTVLKHQNFIGIHHCRKSMGDANAGSSFGGSPQGLQNIL